MYKRQVYKGDSRWVNKDYCQQKIEQYNSGQTPTDEQGRPLVIEEQLNDGQVVFKVVRYREDGSYFEVNPDKERVMFGWMFKEGSNKWGLYEIRIRGTNKNGEHIADLCDSVPVFTPIKIMAFPGKDGRRIYMSKTPFKENKYWEPTDFEKHGMATSINDIMDSLEDRRVDFDDVMDHIASSDPYNLFWFEAYVADIDKEPSQYGGNRIILGGTTLESLVAAAKDETKRIVAWINPSIMSEGCGVNSQVVVFAMGYVRSSDGMPRVIIGGMYPIESFEDFLDIENEIDGIISEEDFITCLLYTSPSPRD